MAEYEGFRMKPEESIRETIDRFLKIVNTSKVLGNPILEESQIKKLLRGLTPRWENKVSILIDKDLSTLTFDHVCGSLLSHEMFMKSKDAEIEQDKKKKGIALKVSTSEGDS